MFYFSHFISLFFKSVFFRICALISIIKDGKMNMTGLIYIPFTEGKVSVSDQHGTFLILFSGQMTNFLTLVLYLKQLA